VIRKKIYSAILSCLTWQACAQNIKVTVINNNNEPIPDMVVYLQPLDATVFESSSDIIEIGQFEKSFTPHISVMQQGTSVKFRNKDDITHHIYSPIGENKFSFKVRAGHEQIKNDFNQLGEVAMGCNIHDWMSGYLLVLDTPLFAKTNSDGQIEMSALPQGKYNVNVWHPQIDEVEHLISQEINLSINANITIKIARDLIVLPAQEHEDDFDFLSDY
jgi:plastocyanin